MSIVELNKNAMKPEERARLENAFERADRRIKISDPEAETGGKPTEVLSEPQPDIQTAAEVSKNSGSAETVKISATEIESATNKKEVLGSILDEMNGRTENLTTDSPDLKAEVKRFLGL